MKIHDFFKKFLVLMILVIVINVAAQAPTMWNKLESMHNGNVYSEVGINMSWSGPVTHYFNSGKFGNGLSVFVWPNKLCKPYSIYANPASFSKENFTIEFYYSKTENMAASRTATMVGGGAQDQQGGSYYYPSDNSGINMRFETDASGNYKLVFSHRLTSAAADAVMYQCDIGNQANMDKVFPYGKPIHLAFTKNNTTGELRIYYNGQDIDDGITVDGVTLDGYYRDTGESWLSSDPSVIAGATGTFDYRLYVGHGCYDSDSVSEAARGTIDNIKIYGYVKSDFDIYNEGLKDIKLSLSSADIIDGIAKQRDDIDVDVTPTGSDSATINFDRIEYYLNNNLSISKDRATFADDIFNHTISGQNGGDYTITIKAFDSDGYIIVSQNDLDFHVDGIIFWSKMEKEENGWIPTEFGGSIGIHDNANEHGQGNFRSAKFGKGLSILRYFDTSYAGTLYANIIPKSDFCVEFWFQRGSPFDNATAYNQYHIISGNDGSGNRFEIILLADDANDGVDVHIQMDGGDNCYLKFAVDSKADLENLFPIGIPVHLSVSKNNAGDVILYINGENKASGSFPALANKTGMIAHQCKIGTKYIGGVQDYRAHGTVDNIKIHNYAKDNFLDRHTEGTTDIALNISSPIDNTEYDEDTTSSIDVSIDMIDNIKKISQINLKVNGSTIEQIPASTLQYNYPTSFPVIAGSYNITAEAVDTDSVVHNVCNNVSVKIKGHILWGKLSDISVSEKGPAGSSISANYTSAENGYFGQALIGVDPVEYTLTKDSQSYNEGTIECWVKFNNVNDIANTTPFEIKNEGANSGSSDDDHVIRVSLDFDDINDKTPVSVYLKGGSSVEYYQYHTANNLRLTEGAWHHIAITWKKGVSQKIFVDGVEITTSIQNSGNYSDIIMDSTSKITLHQSGGFYCYDNVKILNYMKTDFSDRFMEDGQNDTEAPKLTSISSTLASGTYGEGSIIPITFNFTENATLTGADITVNLNSGGSVTIPQASLQGVSSVTVDYTVGVGQIASELMVSSISLNSGTLSDGSANSTSSLSVPGVNIYPDKDLEINGGAPSITDITTSHANGVYAAGEEIEISINFSAPVKLENNSMTVELNSGRSIDIMEFAVFKSTVTFDYIVQSGDNTITDPVEYLKINQIILGTGATLVDALGNNANLLNMQAESEHDIVQTGTSTSKEIGIDTTAPIITLSGVVGNPHELTFDENNNTFPNNATLLTYINDDSNDTESVIENTGDTRIAGDHIVVYKSVDDAGNEDIYNLTIKVIDNTAPAVQIVSPDPVPVAPATEAIIPQTVVIKAEITEQVGSFIDVTTLECIIKNNDTLVETSCGTSQVNASANSVTAYFSPSVVLEGDTLHTVTVKAKNSTAENIPANFSENVVIYKTRTDGSSLWSVSENGGSSIISSSANVAIGTADVPSGYKLAIAGSVIAEKINVKFNNEWPDYVFSPKYNLLPLSDLEQELRKNGHLPGIPSANTIAKDGVDVAQMQALLLKKVEELTLYLIDQNKMIIDQNKKISEQNNINKTQNEILQNKNDKIEKLEKEIKLLKKQIKIGK